MLLPKIAYWLGIGLMLTGLALVIIPLQTETPLTRYDAVLGFGACFGGLLLWGWGRYRWQGDIRE